MIKNLNAKGYVPGTAVFLSVLAPGEQNGCKCKYTIEVYQQGTAVREIKGMNYDPGSPGNDTFAVLSSSQAMPSGALVRIAVYLQQMADANYSVVVKAQQGLKTIMSNTDAGAFKPNEVAVLEYDFYCV